MLCKIGHTYLDITASACMHACKCVIAHFTYIDASMIAIIGSKLIYTLCTLITGDY